MKRIAVVFAVAGLVTGLSAQQPPAAQAPAPPPVTFRAEVNYVEVDAIVTDAQGNVVQNLTADDFELFEDGKPQKVSAFSLVNLPIERAERPLFASRAIEPDVQTNQGSEGRIYLFVLDDQHTDPTRAPRVKAAARRFIEQNFGTNDLAAVVFTGGRSSTDSQDFTNNTRLLLAAIDKFSGNKLRSATIERIESARVNPATGQMAAGDDLFEMERGMRARSAMATVRKLAEFMSNVRGRRKAMLLIGEGVDYNIYDVISANGSSSPSSASAVLEDTRDAVAAATRGNVTIYTIDPRGLSTGTEDLITQSSTFDNAGVSSLQSELRLSQESLRVLAANTGGFAAVNQNDFDTAFDRIVRENSTYYLLGYYSTNERRDGRWRKLQVRTKRPGLQVRSRTGYIAPRGRAPAEPPASTLTNAASPAVREALASPLPVSGVPIKVFAAPFKGTAPNAAIALAVEIDVSQFDFVEKNGAYTERIDVVNTAVDSKGKIFPGERQTVNLAMKPETYQRVKALGLRVLSQTNLPPGRYQVRVAAGNAGGKAGSVVYDLDVPDFSKEELVLSGVALTSMAAPEVTTVRPKDPLADYLPGPVTASRQFKSSDVITLFGEVYENLNRNATHMIDITTELRGEDGRVIRNTSEQRSSSELSGKSGGYGFTARVPLNDLVAGLYVIHVQAKSTLGEERVVSRDVQIRVN